MIAALILSLSLLSDSGPLAKALDATEAPNTFRAAFTVELKSETAVRLYAFDPRRPHDQRWQLLNASGEDAELDQAGEAWGKEQAPDGRLFPSRLRASLGPSIRVDELGGAWRLHFKHHPAASDDAFDQMAAEHLMATAWVDPFGERFLRLDYALPQPVSMPEGGKLNRYTQSYFLKAEPRWGFSYVSGYSVNLEGQRSLVRLARRYSATVTQAEFFFANAAAQAEYESRRAEDKGLRYSVSEGAE
jgi:hypothetical protein